MQCLHNLKLCCISNCLSSHFNSFTLRQVTNMQLNNNVTDKYTTVGD